MEAPFSLPAAPFKEPLPTHKDLQRMIRKEKREAEQLRRDLKRFKENKKAAAHRHAALHREKLHPLLGTKHSVNATSAVAKTRPLGAFGYSMEKDACLFDILASLNRSIPRLLRYANAVDLSEV